MLGAALILLVALIAVFVVLAWLNRRAFRAGKALTPDEDFADLLGLEGIERDIAISVRAAIGHHISVSPKMLHPEDAMSTVKACWWADWGHEVVIWAIEAYWFKHRKDLEIDPKFMLCLHEVGCQNQDALLGEYVQEAVMHYEEYIVEEKAIAPESDKLNT